MLNQSCPKCGYCPTCGRSNQFCTGYLPGTTWGITNSTHSSPNIGHAQNHANHSFIIDKCKDHKE